jgi:hypothetical protein
MKRTIALVASLAVAGALMAGCTGKYTEQFRDASRADDNAGPADTIEFPDGFSNAATKCDHGNRLYVLFHQDSPYGGLAVVPQDPTCKGK